MHEAAIAHDVLGRLLAAAERHGARRILSVRLRVGELSGAVPEALEFALLALAEGTAAAGLRVEIDSVPLEVGCRSCSARGRAEPWLLICGACGSRQLDIVSGRELVLLDVDVEDEEPSPDARQGDQE